MKLFDVPSVSESESVSRGGRVFRKATDMVPKKAFDYSKARQWAPEADFNNLETFYPSEVEKHGVIPQEQLLELYEKYLNLWLEKMPTSKKLQDEGRKNMLWGVFGSYQKDWEMRPGNGGGLPITPYYQGLPPQRETFRALP